MNEQRQAEIQAAYAARDAELAALTTDERYGLYVSNSIADDLVPCTKRAAFGCLSVAEQCRYAR